MFSNFSTAKIGILLEDLSESQNSMKRGPFGRKGGRLSIIFTKLAMFSNFSTAKIGILLEDLSESQNSTTRGPFAYNFYEACNVFKFFNSKDWHFTRRSF